MITECADVTVRFYVLDEFGVWQPEGSGTFTIPDDEDTIVVFDDTRRLVNSPIQPDDIYRVTDSMILMWNDADMGREVAISFQSQAACSVALQQINDIRSKMETSTPAAGRGGKFNHSDCDSSNNTNNANTSFTSGSADTSVEGDDADDSKGGDDSVAPSNVTMANLETMCEFFVRVAKSDPENFIQYLAANPHVISQLMGLFPNVLELVVDGKDDKVNGIVVAMRSILSLVCARPNHNVFNTLLGTYESVALLIHILEHDRDVNPRGTRHSKHVSEKIDTLRSCDDFPLTDEQLRRIKYVYALGYLRESVAPRAIEDDSVVGGPLPQQLNKLRHDIFRSIFMDEDGMSRMVGNLNVRTLGVLYELMSTMKVSFFPLNIREEYALILLRHGFLYNCGPLLYEHSETVRGVVTDLIYQIVFIAPDMVRQLLISPEEEGTQYALLHLMINRLLNESAERVCVIWKDILSMLLCAPAASTTLFLPFRNIFFDSEYHIFEKILHAVHDESTLPSRVTLSFLTYVVQTHWNSVASHFEDHHTLLCLVTRFIKRRNVPVPHRLAACEVLRNVVSLCTPYETGSLIKDGVIKGAVEAILVPRSNPMLASAVVSVCTALYIRKSFPVLRDVQQQCGPAIMSVNGLRQIFHAVSQEPASTTPTATRDFDIDDDDDDVDDDDDANFFSSAGEDEFSVLERDSDYIEEVRASSSSPSTSASSSNGGVGPRMTTTGRVSPEALRKVAAMCRKRVSDEEREDEDIFERLIKKRS
eukprot:PhM_4_TR9761/c0_g1_i1/m.94755/K17491/SMEK, PPP4R3; protein phosphatase 4 regulatory subunit 3